MNWNKINAILGVLALGAVITALAVSGLLTARSPRPQAKPHPRASHPINPEQSSPQLAPAAACEEERKLCEKTAFDLYFKVYKDKGMEKPVKGRDYCWTMKATCQIVDRKTFTPSSEEPSGELLERTRICLPLNLADPCKNDYRALRGERIFRTIRRRYPQTELSWWGDVSTTLILPRSEWNRLSRGERVMLVAYVDRVGSGTNWAIIVGDIIRGDELTVDERVVSSDDLWESTDPAYRGVKGSEFLAPLAAAGE